MSSIAIHQIVKWILALLILVLILLFIPGISEGGGKVLSWVKDIWKINDNKPIKPPDTPKPKENCEKYESFSSCYGAMDKMCIPLTQGHTTIFTGCGHCDDFQPYCTDMKQSTVCNNHPCGLNCVWVQGLKLYVPPGSTWWQKLYKWSIPFSGKCFDNAVYTEMQNDMIANGFISGNIKFAEGKIIEKEIDTSKLVSYVSETGDVLVISKIASSDKQYYVYIKEANNPAIAYNSKGEKVPEKQKQAEEIIKNRKVIQ